MSADFMPMKHRTSLRSHVDITPMHDRHEHRIEIETAGRQAVLMAGRPLLVLDNTANGDHDSLVAALRRAGARRLTAAAWPTDHSFSDRRVELARTVVGWLRSGCGF